MFVLSDVRDKLSAIARHRTYSPIPFSEDTGIKRMRIIFMFSLSLCLGDRYYSKSNIPILIGALYLPMQKLPNISPSKSSAVKLPVISPSAC